jgi:hypothetical protein
MRKHMPVQITGRRYNPIRLTYRRDSKDHVRKRRPRLGVHVLQEDVGVVLVGYLRRRDVGVE